MAIRGRGFYPADSMKVLRRPRRVQVKRDLRRLLVSASCVAYHSAVGCVPDLDHLSADYGKGGVGAGGRVGEAGDLGEGGTPPLGNGGRPGSGGNANAAGGRLSGAGGTVAAAGMAGMSGGGGE